MARPKGGYKLTDGTAIPGTTTIAGRFGDKGGLLQWAFQQGKAGLSSLYEKRDEAADAGTLAHRLVELHISGKADDELQAAMEGQAQAEKALEAYMAYLAWERMMRVTVIDQEISLVSEIHRFGGTLDAIGLIDNQLCLLDWKSGSGPYVEHLLQLAAYRALWEENYPDRPLTGGHHLGKFSKTTGDFSHYYYRDLGEAWELFKLYRRAYDMDKSLAQRLK